MRRRIVRLAIVALGGVLLGAAAYLAALFLGNPSVRQAQGWDLLRSMPSARGETATAVTGDELWVIGGLTGLTFAQSTEVAVYSVPGDAWTLAAPLPSPRDHATAAAGPDRTVYVSGGASPQRTPSAAFWSIRSGEAAWTVLPDMPEPRLASRMVAIGSRLYVVGGIGPSGRVLIYDVQRGRWSTGAEMPAFRDHLAAVVVNGEIWAIGGRVGGRAQTRVDIYDPAADRWRAGPPLPAPTSAAAEGLLGGWLLISGGEDPQVSDRVIDRHWQLDTTARSPNWVRLPDPPLAVHGAQGAVIDGMFVIAGGASRPGSASRFAFSDLVQSYLPALSAQ